MMRDPWVMDDEAYKERRAIIEVECPELSVDWASRLASEDAYRTPLSVAMTQAARGNWEPAKELCRRARERFGEGLAMEVWREIRGKVREVAG